MQYILKHIVLILIAGIFIISSTGLHLTIHYCSTEDFTGLFLFTTEAHCDHNGNHPDPGHLSKDQECDPKDCCDSSLIPGCCSDTVLYIAIEDLFTKSAQPENLLNILPLEVLPGLNKNMVHTPFGQSLILACANYPPVPIYGKELAFYNRQLIL
jgi:hypothetical protein